MDLLDRHIGRLYLVDLLFCFKRGVSEDLLDRGMFSIAARDRDRIRTNTHYNRTSTMLFFLSISSQVTLSLVPLTLAPVMGHFDYHPRQRLRCRLSTRAAPAPTRRPPLR